MNLPLIIGHRGAMGHQTENTLASIQKALDLGVDMIEIDVFKIKSGEIVVFHDDTLERLTSITGKIEELTLEEVNRITLTDNHKIPLLKDVLHLVDKKVSINIELKGANTAKGVLAIMKNGIKNYGWSINHFILSSFNWEELKVARELHEYIRIAVLTEENPLDAIATAKALKAEAINPDFEQLTEEIVNTIRKEDFKIYTWTVNTPAEISQAKAWEVDGIITNFPERV